MKWFIVAAVALAIGFVAGGYAPRTELERTRKELEDARAEVARGERERMTWMSGFSRILAQRAAAPAAPSPPPARVQDTAAPAAGTPRASDDSTDEPEPDDKDDDEAGDTAAGERFDPKDPKSFDAMRTAAQLRAAQYRAAFAEAAHLDARKQAALDEIVRDMNAEVARESERLAATLAAAPGKLRTRQMVDLAQGLLPIYQRADDRLGQLLDPTEQAAAAKTDFDLFSQIDPESVRRLFEVTANRPGAGEQGR